MAAPKPNAQPTKKPMTDAEIATRARAMLADPAFQRMADESRARIAKGEYITWEDLKKELNV